MGKISLILALAFSPVANADTFYYYQGKIVDKAQAFKISIDKPEAVFARITGHGVKFNQRTLRFNKGSDLSLTQIKDLLK